MTITSPHTESFDAARRLLEEHVAIDAAYVLGSAVTGRLRPDSHFDIAVLLRPAAVRSVVDRMGLAARLGSILGRPVDLGLLSHANLVYAKEAVAHGRLIFEGDHGITARFAMRTLSMYAALQEARREVLRAYAGFARRPPPHRGSTVSPTSTPSRSTSTGLPRKCRLATCTPLWAGRGSSLSWAAVTRLRHSGRKGGRL